MAWKTKFKCQILRIGRMFYWQLARGQKGKQKGLSSTVITPPSTSIFTNQYARTSFIVFRIRLRCCCLFAGFARRNISNHWRRHNGVFDCGCGLCSVQSTGFCERTGHQMRGKYATFGWFRTQGWCTYRNVGRLRTQGWLLIEVLVGNSTRGCRMQPFCKQLYKILKYAD